MYLAIENVSTSRKSTKCGQKLMPAIFLSPCMSLWNNHYITEVLEHSRACSISCSCFAREMATLQLNLILQRFFETMNSDRVFGCRKWEDNLHSCMFASV